MGWASNNNNDNNNNNNARLSKCNWNWFFKTCCNQMQCIGRWCKLTESSLRLWLHVLLVCVQCASGVDEAAGRRSLHTGLPAWLPLLSWHHLYFIQLPCKWHLLRVGDYCQFELSWVEDLCHTWHKIGHFGDIIPSQSLEAGTRFRWHLFALLYEQFI